MITKEGFMDIIAMHRSGLSVRNISRALGIHRKTVKKHIEADAFPQYRKRKRGIREYINANVPLKARL